MDLAAFLHAVVAESDGYVSVHWQFPGQKLFPGKSFLTIEEAVEFIQRHSENTNSNIYFCLSRQRYGGGKRTKEFAEKLRSIWMDLDLGDSPKKYARAAEAIASVYRFCVQLGIPKPSLMVLSGGGLHVYWISDKDLTVEEWEPLARGLKAAAKAYGLKADLGLTTDAARVLRPVGTLNYKYNPPRQVRVLEKYSTLKSYDFLKVFGVLDHIPEVSKSWTPGLLGKPAAAFAALPLPQINEEEDVPISFKAIKAECPWLRDAHDTGGKDLTGNMQWNLLLLCSTFLEGGNEIGHQLVNQHPDYSYGATQGLWERKDRERRIKDIGWPSCRTVSDHCGHHCQTCPHLADNKSPLHFGYGVIDNAPDQSSSGQEESSEEDVKKDIEKEIKTLGGTRPEELRLPEGFALDKEGRICGLITSEFDAKGKLKTNPRLLHILKTQIKDPTLQVQNGQFGLGFTASTDKGNWHEVFVPAASMDNKHSLLKVLLNKFVLHNPDSKATPMLEQFAPSWIDKLRLTDTAIKDSGTLGWRYANGELIGFVHGNTLHQQDGTKLPLSAVSDDEFRIWYMPTGKREVWLKAAKLLTDRKRPELDILIAVGFAAPLTVFGGTLYGVTLSMWGHPGTSKSTAQQVAAALFGHPKQTRESLNSTPKSVQKRLGLTKNLAAYWDDVQDERHQDNLFTTMFVAAGGLEGGRLNQDTSMRQRLDWQTLLLACSNASFVEYLIKKQKSTTAGIRRVFEIEFNKKDDEPGMIDAVDASQIFAGLEHNYGVIGAEYAQMLATEHPGIKRLVVSLTKKFKADVKGVGDESYWWGLCGVLLAGATLANRLGAELDIEAMDTALQQAFQYNRDIRKTEGTEGGTIENTGFGLSGFLNKYIGEGNVIYIDRMYQNRHVTVHVMGNPQPGRPIFIQIVKDEGKIIISRKALKEYLEKSEIHSRQIFNGLIAYLGAEEIRATLGAGTDWALTQERCYSIPVTPNKNSDLLQTLAAHDKPMAFKT